MCNSPLGALHVASIDEGVCALAFDDRVEALEPRLRRRFGPFFVFARGDPHGAGRSLERYFDGELIAPTAVKLAVSPTPMQHHVWRLVADIQPGATTTYAALARRLGSPGGQRAVGVCLASNPVPVLIPCHRVIAAHGGLGSHPGGMIVKRRLLEHEGVAFADAGATARDIAVRSRAIGAANDIVDSVELLDWPRYAAR